MPSLECCASYTMTDPYTLWPLACGLKLVLVFGPSSASAHMLRPTRPTRPAHMPRLHAPPACPAHMPWQALSQRMGNVGNGFADRGGGGGTARGLVSRSFLRTRRHQRRRHAPPVIGDTSLSNVAYEPKGYRLAAGEATGTLLSPEGFSSSCNVPSSVPSTPAEAWRLQPTELANWSMHAVLNSSQLQPAPLTLVLVPRVSVWRSTCLQDSQCAGPKHGEHHEGRCAEAGRHAKGSREVIG